MRIAIFLGLPDRRLMNEEKCIESFTLSLLITKSHHFQISDNILALQRSFSNLYCFFRRIVVIVGHLNLDKLKTNIQMSFQKVFLSSRLYWCSRKIDSEVQVIALSGWNIAVPLLSWPNVIVGQNNY